MEPSYSLYGLGAVISFVLGVATLVANDHHDEEGAWIFMIVAAALWPLTALIVLGAALGKFTKFVLGWR